MTGYHTRNAANEFTFVKRNTDNASPPIVIVNKNSNTASATQPANASIFKDVNSDISNGQIVKEQNSHSKSKEHLTRQRSSPNAVGNQINSNSAHGKTEQSIPHQSSNQEGTGGPIKISKHSSRHASTHGGNSSAGGQDKSNMPLTGFQINSEHFQTVRRE